MNEEDFSKLEVFDNYYDEMKPHMTQAYKDFILELIDNNIEINDTGISTMTGMGLTIYKEVNGEDFEYCIEFLANGRILVTEVFPDSYKKHEHDINLKVHKYHENESDYTEKILQLIK
jgi:hypothetical protein